MWKKNNIIQFLPYFPPHKWWLETVAEELSYYYVQKWYWEVINITFDIGQEISNLEEKDFIRYNNAILWYHKRWYLVYMIPSFDLISNFPVPKFWKKEFWEILRRIKYLILNPTEEYFIQTHTRFFLSTLLGGICAKYYKIKWIHIEHWSDYVVLWSKLKTKISYFYDRLIWKWVFKKSDLVICISEACKKFIIKNFVNRNIEVVYRWLEINLKNPINIENLKEKFPWKIIIWFVWRILKWKNVNSLIQAYYLLDNELANKVQIVIVWDGEELQNLKKLDTDNKIYFAWSQDFNNALLLQKQFDIHFHTSSPGWGLATTLLQAMYLWCLIIATPYEWADEVILNWKNGILLENDTVAIFIKWIERAIHKLGKKEEWSKVNREIIANKFAWEKNIVRYWELFKY